MSQDKTTISVSVAGQAVLDQLTHDREFFKTELAAFLATAALAVALELPTDTELGPMGQTKWNKGSGDVGEWARLVEWYLPTEEPVRALEAYAEAGLRHVGVQLSQGASMGDIYVVAP